MISEWWKVFTLRTRVELVYNEDKNPLGGYIIGISQDSMHPEELTFTVEWDNGYTSAGYSLNDLRLEEAEIPL